MKLTRRNFVSLTSAAMVASPLFNQAKAVGNDNPLGIRQDFLLLEKVNFLNTAYHAVSPKQVVNAGVQFYKDRSNPADSIGPFLAQGREVRAKFAKIVGADHGEIGLIHSTTEAENIVAGALDLKEGDIVVTNRF